MVSPHTQAHGPSQTMQLDVVVHVHGRTLRVAYGSHRVCHRSALHRAVVHAAMAHPLKRYALGRLLESLRSKVGPPPTDVGALRRHAQALLAQGVLVVVAHPQRAGFVPKALVAPAKPPEVAPEAKPKDQAPTAVLLWHGAHLPLVTTVTLHAPDERDTTFQTGGDVVWHALSGHQATITVTGLAQALAARTLHLWRPGS